MNRYIGLEVERVKLRMIKFVLRGMFRNERVASMFGAQSVGCSLPLAGFGNQDGPGGYAALVSEMSQAVC